MENIEENPPPSTATNMLYADVLDDSSQPLPIVITPELRPAMITKRAEYSRRKLEVFLSMHPVDALGGTTRKADSKFRGRQASAYYKDAALKEQISDLALEEDVVDRREALDACLQLGINFTNEEFDTAFRIIRSYAQGRRRIA